MHYLKKKNKDKTKRDKHFDLNVFPPGMVPVASGFEAKELIALPDTSKHLQPLYNSGRVDFSRLLCQLHRSAIAAVGFFK